MKGWWCWLAALPIAAALPVQADGPLLQPLGAAGEPPPAPWHLAGLPRQRKPLTQFTVIDLDGRRALRIEADGSYGNLVHPLRTEADALKLSWQWRVDQLLEAADLRQKSGDDIAAKVCVFFDEPMSQVPFVERQLLRMARAASDEPLPAATVCYVWDSRLPEGTALYNAYTHRVRYIVVQSGPAQLRRWVAERRDVAADFRLLFGDESPQVPAIVGVGVGADADNTGGRSLAHVADLVLAP